MYYKWYHWIEINQEKILGWFLVFTVASQNSPICNLKATNALL
jgi:hypothetical protein